MPGRTTAQSKITDAGASPAPATTLVVVDDPQRLNRELLVAAIDAVPGFSAIDASAASSTALDRADAAVVAARSLQFGSRGVLAARWSSPRRVVVIADNGPVSPCGDGRGLVVVSRDTPLGVVVGALQSDAAHRDGLDECPPARKEDASLTPRERQVLGLLASGLSPTEVARGLDITIYTTRDHIKAIRQKLDRPTIMAAVLEAIRRGVLQLDRT